MLRNTRRGETLNFGYGANPCINPCIRSVHATPCACRGGYGKVEAQMEAFKALLPYAEIALSLLLIIGIILQQRGSSLGGAFGGDNFASTFYKRRGAEKFLFNATIVIAILYVAGAIAGFLI